MGCVVPQYRCYKTYSAALMKCGSRLLKSKLFKLAPLYGTLLHLGNSHMLTLPCNALKPCSGTRELPVTNCSSRALCSSSYSSTARQNHRTTLVSSEQCFNREFRFQSSTSILPSPPIISCINDNSGCYTIIRSIHWVAEMRKQILYNNYSCCCCCY